ncbi:hypothetical protein JOD24_001756 [Kroppenstedtia sanguinis]|uniref:GNAT family N-acetyltransferase n=1 Tax=Kroppenstedtia sanguinis TaxID=1380684 RepID=A0ABW4CDB9_9BACL
MQIQSRKERCRNGSEFIIRSAVLEDASALLDLARSVIAEGHYQITELSEFQLTVGQERKWIREMTNSQDGVILVAEARGKVIGMLDFQGE